jgi:hypothetical protein
MKLLFYSGRFSFRAQMQILCALQKPKHQQMKWAKSHAPQFAAESDTVEKHLPLSDSIGKVSPD